MKTITNLILLFFISTLASGQLLFEGIYGDAPNFERTNSIIQDGDAVVLTGYTTLQTNGGDDVLLLKLDTEGNLIWKKQIGGSKNEQAIKIKLLSDGYLIAGHTKSIGNGNQDFYLIKTDFEGNLVWERSYGTENLEYCTDVIVTPDGGFLLIGTGVQNITSGEDWWLVKTDNAGNIQWSNYYGTEGRDHPTFVKILSDGNFMVGGGYHGQRRLNKIDTDGNLIWSFGPSSTGFSYIKTVDAIELANGDILMAYSSLGPSYSKLSSNGELIYEQWPLGIGGEFDRPLKFQAITEDSILLLNRSSIIAFSPDSGDTTASFDWSYSFPFIFTQINDLLVTDDHYYVAATHLRTHDESLDHDGIVYQNYNQNFELEATYIDTFELINYTEYSEKVIETTSGDFLLFGARQYRNSAAATENILLTRTNAEGDLIEEIALDKGWQAKPIDMYYTDLGNLILLTQLTQDTMELSMVNDDGLTLWGHTFSGNFETTSHGKTGFLTTYPSDQFLLVLNGREYYIFDEEGNINFNYQSNAPTVGSPVNLKILSDGRILYVNSNQLILLENDASWISSTLLIPAGFTVVEYFDFHFESEDNIWLIGKTRMPISDLGQYVIMQINADGERLSEFTFEENMYDQIPNLELLSVEDDRLIVYGNKELPWPYETSNVSNYNCIRKPLNIGFLEEWSKEGTILSRLEFGVGQGTNVSDMITTSDNNIAGSGWIYDTNSDDQYLVKIDRTNFVPTHESDLKFEDQLLIYPNPGTASLFLELNTEITGTPIIRIFNAAGQLVRLEKSENIFSTTTVEFDTTDFPNGVYYIHVNIGNEWRATDYWIKMD